MRGRIGREEAEGEDGAKWRENDDGDGMYDEMEVGHNSQVINFIKLLSGNFFFLSLEK